jgi:hypothetical protein
VDSKHICIKKSLLQLVQLNVLDNKAFIFHSQAGNAPNVATNIHFRMADNEKQDEI